MEHFGSVSISLAKEVLRRLIRLVASIEKSRLPEDVGENNFEIAGFVKNDHSAPNIIDLKGDDSNIIANLNVCDNFIDGMKRVVFQSNFIIRGTRHTIQTIPILVRPGPAPMNFVFPSWPLLDYKPLVEDAVFLLPYLKQLSYIRVIISDTEEEDKELKWREYGASGYYEVVPDDYPNYDYDHTTENVANPPTPAQQKRKFTDVIREIWNITPSRIILYNMMGYSWNHVIIYDKEMARAHVETLLAPPSREPDDSHPAYRSREYFKLVGKYKPIMREDDKGRDYFAPIENEKKRKRQEEVHELERQRRLIREARDIARAIELETSEANYHRLMLRDRNKEGFPGEQKSLYDEVDGLLKTP